MKAVRIGAGIFGLLVAGWLLLHGLFLFFDWVFGVR